MPVPAQVRTADIICTTTNASEPVFKGAWLAPGTHINGVGSYTPQMQELDVATVRQCHVVVDSEHALAAGDLAIPLQDDTLMYARSHSHAHPFITAAWLSCKTHLAAPAPRTRARARQCRAGWITC